MRCVSVALVDAFLVVFGDMRNVDGRKAQGGLVWSRRTKPKDYSAKQVPDNVGNIPVEEFTL